MTPLTAITTLQKYAPCPHLSYDDTLGNGKVWARCHDCGNEFKQENLEKHRKAAKDFQTAFDVLARNSDEDMVKAEQLHEWFDQMGVPVEDDTGHTLTIEERMTELRHQRKSMQERLYAYGFSKPAEELLRVQRELLSRPHPDIAPLRFVQDVCELFGFAPPPPVPDWIWYESALAVIRDRLSS